MAVNDLIILRKGTATQWSSANPVLASGEPGFDLTNNLLKIGDGTKTWNQLSSINGSGGGGGGSGATELYSYASVSGFPQSGLSPAIYLSTDSGRTYQWNGSSYSEIGPIGGGDTTLWNLFLPGAPTSVAGSTDDTQSVVTWTAPTGVATQTPITDYIIQYSINGGTSWTTYADTMSTNTSITVTGLTNGSGYIFRVAAVNIIGTGNYSLASSSVTPSASDSLFGTVGLLLHMEGSASTFIDSSAYNVNVTAVGSVTQSTAQAKYGTKSLLISSGDNYLSAGGSQFVVGTGDYTAEAWIYPTSVGGAYRHIFDTRTTDSTGFALGLDDSNRVFLFSNNAFRVQTGSVALNQWHHLAVCRAAGVTRVFLNGAQVGSDWANSMNYSETTLLIGRYYASASYQWFGHIDEVRWSNTARYTTTFSTPTSAFPEAAAGTDPFYSNVSLLLLLNGSNNSTTFTDSGPIGHTVSTTNAIISTTQSKFSGSSLYLNGSAYLSIPSHSSLSLGTGDFTIEFWAYCTDQTTPYPGYINSQGGWNAGAYGIRFDNNLAAQKWGFWKNPSDPLMTSSSTYAFNTWRHVALVRQGTTWRMYVDGVQACSSTTQGTDSFDLAYGGTMRIGYGTWDGGNGYVTDYIDCLRITKGICRYQNGTTFTPSSTEFATS